MKKKEEKLTIKSIMRQAALKYIRKYFNNDIEIADSSINILTNMLLHERKFTPFTQNELDIMRKMLELRKVYTEERIKISAIDSYSYKRDKKDLSGIDIMLSKIKDLTN